MRYKAVFIDIDDTLLDYIPCCREAFDYALQELKAKKYASCAPQNEDYLFQLFFAISGRLFSEAKHGLHTVAEVMELYPKEFIERAGYPSEAVDPFKHAFRFAWGKTHTLVPEAEEMLESLQNKCYRLLQVIVLVISNAAGLNMPAYCTILKTLISLWTSAMTSRTSVFIRKHFVVAGYWLKRCS